MQMFTAKLLYMFRTSIAPIMRSPYLVTFEEACSPDSVRSVPEAATTVLCTPDDGRDGHPKHVE